MSIKLKTQGYEFKTQLKIGVAKDTETQLKIGVAKVHLPLANLIEDTEKTASRQKDTKTHPS